MLIGQAGGAGAQPGGGAEPSHLPRSAPVLELLRREAKVLTPLHHPNIVELLGISLEPASLVTEFCARGSLFKILQDARGLPALAEELTWPLRLSLACDACLGMVYLHSRSPPLLHRDLKAANILVDAAWRAKVADFGLSKLMPKDGGLSSTLKAVNVKWMAPEAVTGESYTTAADVFSFGVVLWELLTWREPWGESAQYNVILNVTKGNRLPVPRPEALPGSGSGDWTGLGSYVALMQRCWAQDPLERPSFGEVDAQLRHLRC